MRRMLMATTGLLLAACASSGPRAPSPTRNSNVITAEELATVNVTTAAEAVLRLRPQWLRTRGPSSLSGGGNTPRVYVDRSSAGGLDTLQGISIHIVQEIRFFSGRDASVRYGLGHDNGVIMVLTVGR